MRLPPAIILALLSSWSADAQTYAISTFAGGGLPVNIPGTSASLYGPQAVAVDKTGSVFFTENSVVLRLDAVTGLLSLVAGNGTYGFSGDGGPATGAQLTQPNSLTVDFAGNLYFSDSGAIRKVSNGVITSLQVSGYGIAVDSSGILYAVDGNTVLKISNGAVTTVAGNGTQGFSGDNGPATSGQLSRPFSVAVDTAGSVYIADTGNNRVRKVSNGVITTVAGNGIIGYNGNEGQPGSDTGPSIGDGGPATSAEFGQNGPLGVAVDPADNLYISDGVKVRKVTNGVITTVAGGGAPTVDQYNNPRDIGDGGPATRAFLNSFNVAVDSSGNLYLADIDNNEIRKVSNGIITSLAGNRTDGDGGPATSVELSDPEVVAVDAARNVYIADSAICRVRKVSSGVISTVAGSGKCGLNFNDNNGPATSAWVAPTGVAVDGAGNIYISDSETCRIRKVANGVITTVVGITGFQTCGYSGDNGLATNAQVNLPSGLVVDAGGNLYIADRYNNRIRKLSNGMITTVAGNGTPGYSGDGGLASSAQLSGPTGVAVDSTGNLYIVDSGNQRIRRVANGIIATVATVGPIVDPTGVAVDAAGILYIAGDSVDGYGFVQRLAGGVNTTIAGGGSGPGIGDNGPATSAQLDLPSGVAVDSAGNVYIADRWNNRIRLLTPAASQTITFEPLSDVTFGVSPFVITAKASSGLTVTFASATPVVCTISGTTVTIVAAGACSIMATQAGNAIFGAATPVVRSFAVGKAPQSISFPIPGAIIFTTAPVMFMATASSGLAVNFVSDTLTVCSVTGATATVFAVGNCSITASQAGNANYAPAPEVTESFNIIGRNTQSRPGPVTPKPR